MAFRDQLYTGLNALLVYGRIQVAAEGLNGQASVPRSSFEACKNMLYSFPCLKDMRLNMAIEDSSRSFWVLKIRVREKIVADGITDPTFDATQTGQYLDARSFNLLTENPETVVVDMRNHYEYEVGHFDKALELPSDTFRDQLPQATEILQNHQDKPIVMYCTGGIRCEKASAYLLHHGFRQVYHLEGGIISYARQVREQGLENKFKGKNFVFDGRMGERITGDIISHCHQCGEPCDTHTNCRNAGCHLLFIQCEACKMKFDGCCSQTCMQVIHLPLEEQKQLRKGAFRGQMINHKSKQGLRPRLNRAQG